ncbi:MAG: glycosyltransferase [Thermoanaerobaculales bacterium]|jgi:glycosyltransferase involved in cell wall biosynthesis|nr:glycosyltransferase [Thermoanaerobaculales bacterium]
MDRPAVSVLLPVRNAEQWLGDCLGSLRRQTLTDFEVVAVDDGSSDGSAVILERHAASDRRIHVLQTPPRGLVPALNHGLQECRAPLVARMDADDISHPQRLELQANLLTAVPGVGVVSCLVRHFPKCSVAKGFRLYEEWLNSLVDHGAMARERFIESPLAHPSAVVRREHLVDVGGWRDVGWPEDYDLWLRLFQCGVGFAKVARPLFFWREHHMRLTRIDASYSVPNFLRCKAHYLARGPLTESRRIILWGAGQTGRRLSKHLLDEGVAIDAVVDIDPAKIDRTMRGLPIIAVDELPPRLDEDTVVLAAVASRGARSLIRGRLSAMDLVEGKTFWCVA